ncbi:MAG: DUF362 domain-containing protein [Actinobacteria bacterium]|nr:DUF362 domain-containing protein [Actinomycetota bacterium]
MSDVYFAPVGAFKDKGLIQKIPLLFRKAGSSEIIEDGDLVAVKVHFGELGSSSFIPGFYVREIVEAVKVGGGKPFLTDTGTLYLGKRRNAYDHLNTARSNGFTQASTGAPVIIGDGLRGSDVKQVEISGDYFDHVDIAGAIAQADSLVVVTHITGHDLTGFAGTFKNLGMGAVGRKVKLAIHEAVKPVVKKDDCTACAVCVKNCPADAIAIDPKDRIAVIDLDKCIGCGECVGVCPERAVVVKWSGEGEKANMKLIEAASAVVRQKKGRITYFSFLLNVSPSCDCWNYSKAPMVPDIGVLASSDPVSIDQAAADMVKSAPGGINEAFRDPELRFKVPAGGSWEVQLKKAEEMGLGEREYRLINIDE